MLPALRHVLGFVDHHCHGLRRDWAQVAADGGDSRGGPGGDAVDTAPTRPAEVGPRWPRWRGCFTESSVPEVLARDVPNLLTYRHFLTAYAGLLGMDADGGLAGAATTWTGDSPAAAAAPGPQLDTERALACERDRRAGEAYLRRLFGDAGMMALLVDTGFGGAEALRVEEMSTATGRQVREVVRLETAAEAVLAEGGLPARSLDAFVDAVLSRLAEAIDGGAVAIKSVLAYRAGLHLPGSSVLGARQAFTLAARRRQARRFDDPVLAPFLVRAAAELAAARGVPLQVHTGLGDTDIDLRSADPALLRPLFHDPRTEGCRVVLLHCHPYARAASHLAGIYPQVFMDLSLAIPLAEPIAATLVREALALCPASKLLAASDGHSYPEMHWWGAAVWDRALREVLDAEIAAGQLDEAAAMDIAGRILVGNARDLYGLDAGFP